MSKVQEDRIRTLRRALQIAAEMFASEGYDAPNGDGGAAAIERFLIRRANEELRGLEQTPEEGT